ncbi:MAG: MFS transporter [Bryobacteraceae bacterium]
MNGAGGRHWWMIGGLFLMSVLTIVDRVCVSTAKGGMAAELALSDRQFGWVFAVFSLGYALCQIPSGALADRIGARRFLSAIVALWSLFTAFTGAVHGFAALLLVRLLFGVAESGAYPGAARAIYSRLETRHRGLAQGVVLAGSRLGAAFGLVIMSWAVERLGWRDSFSLLAAAGFVWAAGWYVLFRDGVQTNTPSPPPFAWSALAHGNAIFLLFQYFASNFTFYLCVTWLLPYLKDRYALSTVEAGVYASMPMYAGAIANWSSGVVIDALYRGGRWRLSRAGPAFGGFVLAAATLAIAAEMATPRMAVLFFSLATFGVDLALSPSWVTAGDIGGQYTGTVSGAMNTAGNLGALVSSLAFPYLIAWTGTAKTYFYVTAALNVAGAVCWWRIRPDHPIAIRRSV